MASSKNNRIQKSQLIVTPIKERKGWVLLSWNYNHSDGDWKVLPNNSKPNNSKPDNSKLNNSKPNNSKPNNSKPNRLKSKRKNIK